MPGKTPSVSDLYHLAEQLELDAELPVQLVRERDHALAAGCAGEDDVGMLRHWLACLRAQRAGRRESWLSEASAVVLGRLLALFFGFASMATFLLTSGRGLVNVFMFLLLFVFAQLALCLVASWVMVRTVAGGQAPVVLPLNPARLLVARAFPDRRYFREAQSVLRLVFLRLGQELGAIFTLGAVAAFFVVLALSDFTFVWGSTFDLSDTLVEDMTALMAAPWIALVPQATVNGDLIFATRFHPAITTLSPDNIAGMRGWWPFLIMAMVTYALLPRLLLWLLSKFFYRRQMRAAFVQLPGSQRVLARMKAPLVETRGEGSAADTPKARTNSIAIDQRVLLLNWANALTPEDLARFEAFAAVADGNIVNAGLGSLPEELERLRARFAGPVEHLCVAVKSWEPPMADLADFLANFTGVPRCTLFLVPLAHKAVTTARLADWQVFARSLDLAVVDVQALERE
jgi:hypothetical protein